MLESIGYKLFAGGHLTKVGGGCVFIQVYEYCSPEPLSTEILSLLEFLRNAEETMKAFLDTSKAVMKGVQAYDLGGDGNEAVEELAKLVRKVEKTPIW